MFIALRMMNPPWKKQLLKAAYIVLELKLGHPRLACGDS